MPVDMPIAYVAIALIAGLGLIAIAAAALVALTRPARRQRRAWHDRHGRVLEVASTSPTARPVARSPVSEVQNNLHRGGK